MTTLSIRLEPEGPVLVLQDLDWEIAEACLIRDPFLRGLVSEAEHRLALRHSTVDP